VQQHSWLSALLPLGPGEYIIDHFSLFYPDGGLGAASIGYELEFNVAPVPLPAAAWLLISGLGALGLTARRRRVG
jgi:hypothetical protein